MDEVSDVLARVRLQFGLRETSNFLLQLLVVVNLLEFLGFRWNLAPMVMRILGDVVGVGLVDAKSAWVSLRLG